MNEITLPLWIS